jgi:anaerobic selenocysteine-containing dehydrogenase
MYHSWGSQNAWLRQIHTKNVLYVPGPICDEHGLKDGDWARVSSWHSSIRVPIARMEAVNNSTMWTWNAIGKRKGAWNLSPKAPEATEGFLLNHLIHELLPPKGDGLRWANSDPITGQAAWYDLRVSITRDSDQTSPESQPGFGDVGARKMLGNPPDDLRYGQEWTRETSS